MTGRTKLALCCVVLVLAGCSSAPVDTATTTDGVATTEPVSKPTDSAATTESGATTTESPSENVPTLESVSINESRVLERTKRLLGGGEFPKFGVGVQQYSASDTRQVEIPFEFTQAFGVPNATTERELWTDGTALYQSNSVNLRLSNRSTAREVRAVLVHEYAHLMIIQYKSFVQNVRPPTRRIIDEGSATFVAQQYAERYGNTLPNQDVYCEIYENGTAAERLKLGAYCEGARYIDGRVDDPANIETVYENPPNTTEQVRHGYLPGEEPPVDLAVNATDGNGWYLDDRERQGELWTYAVLSTHLSDTRADQAATGWDNDTRLTYTSSGEESYAWVTRWDSPADADEFATAMRAHAANATAGSATNAKFDVERVNETIVVVLVGEEAFVRKITVTATDTAVVVDPSASATNSTATERAVGPAMVVESTLTPHPESYQVVSLATGRGQ